MTYYDESINKVDVWSVVFTYRNKGSLTTFATGGIAALVDHRASRLSTCYNKTSVRGERFHIHPVSGEKITGCIIPYYDQATAFSQASCYENSESEVSGWDVAITETGPYMLEGNDNWCMTFISVTRRRRVAAFGQSGLQYVFCL